MSYKSIVVALLGLSLTGCAVYGGGGYGHRGYDRGYTTVYYRTQPYPVYVVPRYERHGIRRRSYRGYGILNSLESRGIVIHRFVGSGQDHDRLLDLD